KLTTRSLLTSVERAVGSHILQCLEPGAVGVTQSPSWKPSDPADGTTRRPMWHEFICMCAVHGCTWARMLSQRPLLARRTIRVLNQSLWLKSLTARQRCLPGNAKALPFLRKKSPYIPTPNLEDQETVFVRPLAIDQPGMRGSVSVAGTPPSIAQWVAEVRKPPHHGKVQSFRPMSIQMQIYYHYCDGHKHKCF
ncbi:hypothetical protein CSKR_103516, partial [Clonorchis sinensis]